MRKRQPTPIFLPGKFHGQRNLVGYSPWGHKDLDTTKQLSMHHFVSKRKLWYIYTMEYYSAIKKNTFESVLMRWMKLEPNYPGISQKEKHQ